MDWYRLYLKLIENPTLIRECEITPLEILQRAAQSSPNNEIGFWKACVNKASNGRRPLEEEIFVARQKLEVDRDNKVRNTIHLCIALEKRGTLEDLKEALNLEINEIRPKTHEVGKADDAIKRLRGKIQAKEEAGECESSETSELELMLKNARSTNTARAWYRLYSYLVRHPALIPECEITPLEILHRAAQSSPPTGIKRWVNYMNELFTHKRPAEEEIFVARQKLKVDQDNKVRNTIHLCIALKKRGTLEDLKEALNLEIKNVRPKTDEVAKADHTIKKLRARIKQLEGKIPRKPAPARAAVPPRAAAPPPTATHQRTTIKKSAAVPPRTAPAPRLAARPPAPIEEENPVLANLNDSNLPVFIKSLQHAAKAWPLAIGPELRGEGWHEIPPHEQDRVTEITNRLKGAVQAQIKSGRKRNRGKDQKAWNQLGKSWGQFERSVKQGTLNVQALATFHERAQILIGQI